MALNDILFSEEFMFEGEQAEAYKKRKAAERRYNASQDDDYMVRRWKEVGYTSDMSEKDKKKHAKAAGHDHYRYDNDGKLLQTSKEPGEKMTKQNPNYGIKHPIKTAKGMNADEKNREKARDIMSVKTGEQRKHSDVYRDKRSYNSDVDRYRAQDAALRHARRHGAKQESVELYGGLELI